MLEVTAETVLATKVELAMEVEFVVADVVAFAFSLALLSATVVELDSPPLLAGLPDDCGVLFDPVSDGAGDDAEACVDVIDEVVGPSRLCI